jgi:hypothetical protein
MRCGQIGAAPAASGARERNPEMNNTNRITIADYLKRYGRTLMEIAHAVLLGDENAPALCEHGCEVEPDGKCCHGCPSILRAAGLI